MSNIERRVSDLEAREQVRNEAHELKSWKMKLQYPFAIIGVFVVGGFTWLGSHLFRFFTGE